MDTREILKDIVAEYITEERLNSIIREIIIKKLDYNLEQHIRKTAVDVLGEKTQEYVKEKVEAELVKPVKTNDGWGNIARYDSFEEFVKKEIAERLRNNWEIRTYAENFVKQMITDTARKIVKDFTDEELNERLLKQLIAKADNR